MSTTWPPPPPYRATWAGRNDIDIPDDAIVTVLWHHGSGPHGTATIAYTNPNPDDIEGEGIWEVDTHRLRQPLWDELLAADVRAQRADDDE